MKNIKIILLGDVMGPASAEYVSKKLWAKRKEFNADMVIANAENCAPGNGINRENCEKLIDGGCDVLTTGNHVFKKSEAKYLLEDRNDIIRPANFPPDVPGYGYLIKDMGAFTVLVINVMGVTFMEPLANPFRTVEKILEDNKGKYDISVLDIHAEATSEKRALGFYFDGKIDIIVGTHTHVQTADEQILPCGSAYITDLGMCGPDNSVLGVCPECIIERLTKNMPVRHILSENEPKAHGICVTFGENARPCAIERIVF